MSERVHLVSLGCPKNRVDSEVMIGKIRGADCTLVDSPDEADVIVVNTCSFIQPATEESIDTVLEMAGYKETGSCEKLIVTGCMVQRFGNALEDELLATGDKWFVEAYGLSGLPNRSGTIGGAPNLHSCERSAVIIAPAFSR